jgi:hypothetical protein
MGLPGLCSVCAGGVPPRRIVRRVGRVVFGASGDRGGGVRTEGTARAGTLQHLCGATRAKSLETPPLGVGLRKAHIEVHRRTAFGGGSTGCRTDSGDQARELPSVCGGQSRPPSRGVSSRCQTELEKVVAAGSSSSGNTGSLGAILEFAPDREDQSQSRGRADSRSTLALAGGARAVLERTHQTPAARPCCLTCATADPNCCHLGCTAQAL